MSDKKLSVDKDGYLLDENGKPLTLRMTWSTRMLMRLIWWLKDRR